MTEPDKSFPLVTEPRCSDLRDGQMPSDGVIPSGIQDRISRMEVLIYVTYMPLKGRSSKASTHITKVWRKQYRPPARGNGRRTGSLEALECRTE
jgi:hypothetical protein